MTSRAAWRLSTGSGWGAMVDGSARDCGMNGPFCRGSCVGDSGLSGVFKVVVTGEVVGCWMFGVPLLWGSVWEGFERAAPPGYKANGLYFQMHFLREDFSLRIGESMKATCNCVVSLPLLGMSGPPT